MVSRSSSNSGWQSKIFCTDCTPSLRKGNSGSLLRRLNVDNCAVLFSLFWLGPFRCLVLNFWKTAADGSDVRLKVVFPCFSAFQFSAHCSLARWRAAVLYDNVKVGIWGGVCNGVEGGPVALHLVASFAAMSADSLPVTPA